MALVKQSEYARLKGISRQRISQLVKRGDIILLDGLVDVEATEALLEQKRDPAYAHLEKRRPIGEQPAPAPKPKTEPKPQPETTKRRTIESEPDELDDEDNPKDFAAAKTMREKYLALQAKLDYLAKAGQLVDAEEVKSAWANIVSTSRTKVLSIPSKARARLPHLTDTDYDVLEQLVRESLEDLACQR